jgi:hypothetical protein
VPYRRRKILFSAVIFVAVVSCCEVGFCAQTDFVLDGVYEAAIDLPRISFILKREPNGPAMNSAGDLLQNYAFLDTGASGVLLSRQTATAVGLATEPNARFVDVGIGGEEYFDVSEPVHIGLGDFELTGIRNEKSYKLLGPGRIQLRREGLSLLGEGIDVMGMPVMAGRVFVLDSGATNEAGFFAACIKERGDESIPESDIVVALRFENFLNTSNPRNKGPLPSLSYNPVIDNVVVSYRGKSSKGNWLLDTGATISFISSEQAQRLGLVDKRGTALVRKAFSLPLGGVGTMVDVPGFEVDRLTVPTLSGGDLVFHKARIGVHDVRYFDEEEGKFAVLEGVFGSNFLCASAKIEGFSAENVLAMIFQQDASFDFDIGRTAFDKIVLDMEKGLLGLDMKNGERPR